MSAAFSVAAMALSSALCMLPVAVIPYVLKTRYGAKLVNMAAGLGVYLLVSLLILGLAQAALGSMLENSAFFVLYGVVIAVLAEESGRYLYFRFMRARWQNGLAAPLLFGLGTCVIEMFVVGANALSGAVLMGRLLSAGNAETLAASFSTPTEDLLPQLRELEQMLREKSPFYFLTGGIERVSILCLQISASVTLYPAATGRGPLWLFPAAAGLRALGSLPAVLSRAGLLQSLVLTELFMTLAACLAAAVAWRFWRRYGDYGLKQPDYGKTLR